jgi:hypothetical protein
MQRVPLHRVRCVAIDDDASLAAALEGLPWSPAERRRRVGRRLEQTLVAARADGDANPAAPDTAAAAVEATGGESGDASTNNAASTDTSGGSGGGGGTSTTSCISEAAHGLWELAVERPHHVDFSEDMLRAIVSGLSCPEWDVALYSAGSVWQLARSAQTRRGVVHLGVVAALQALMRRSIHAPSEQGTLTYATRMHIQDFCAGCMGVLMVDKEARRALFSEFPNASDLVGL